jgi:hypothetical protein
MTKLSLIRLKTNHHYHSRRSSGSIGNLLNSIRYSQGDLEQYNYLKGRGFMVPKDAKYKRKQSIKRNDSNDFSRKMSIENLENITLRNNPNHYEIDKLHRLKLMSASLTAFIFCVLVFSIYQRVKVM